MQRQGRRPSRPVKGVQALHASWFFFFLVPKWHWFFFIYLLGYICFTTLCSFWVQRSESASHTYTHTPSLLDFPPSQISTEHGVEFLELHSRPPLVLSSVHSSVYGSIPISQFIPPCLFLLDVHTFVLYICVSSISIHTLWATPPLNHCYKTPHRIKPRVGTHSFWGAGAHCIPLCLTKQ